MRAENERNYQDCLLDFQKAFDTLDVASGEIEQIRASSLHKQAFKNLVET